MKKMGKVTRHHRRCLNCSVALVPLYHEIKIDPSSSSPTIKIKDAISALYGLRFLDSIPSPLIRNYDNSKTYLCGPCSEIVAVLYTPWTKFNERRSMNSELAIQLKKMDEIFGLIHERVRECNDGDNYENKSKEDENDSHNDHCNYQIQSTQVQDQIPVFIKTEGDIVEKKYLPELDEEEEDDQVSDFCEISLSFDLDDTGVLDQDEEDMDDNEISEDPLALKSSNVSGQHSRQTFNHNKNNNNINQPSIKINKNEKQKQTTSTHPVFNTSTEDFEKHQETRMNKVPTQCMFCEENFPELFMLYSHLRIHANRLPFNCPYCKKYFASKSKLLNHLKEAHSEFDFQSSKYFDSIHCTLCAETFQFPSVLKEHQAKHWTKYKNCVFRKKLTCIFCGHQSANESSWLKHIGTHGDWSCSVCQKSFKYQGNLLVHQKKSLENLAKAQEEDPDSFVDTMTCRVPSCTAQFCFFAELKAHEEEGHTEKPFDCPSCQRSFSVEFNLKVHQTTCIGSGKTKCPLLPDCQLKDVIFDTSDDLKTHLLSHASKVEAEDAPGKSVFECPLCLKTFMYIGMLKIHLRMHTGESKKYPVTPTGQNVDRKVFKIGRCKKKLERCLKCGKMFRTATLFKKHMASHRQAYDIKCPNCNRVFTKQDPLNVHIRRVHQKLPAYPCALEGCEEAFDKRRLLLQHYEGTGHNKSTRDIVNDEVIVISEVGLDVVVIKVENEDNISLESDEEEFE